MATSRAVKKASTVRKGSVSKAKATKATGSRRGQSIAGVNQFLADAAVRHPIRVTPPASTIEDTLRDRGSKYGSFITHARITQDLKCVMRGGANLGCAHTNWSQLTSSQQECLEMIAHKIGRILNGDPTYVDSWTDIIGYTRLVEKELLREELL